MHSTSKLYTGKSHTNALMHAIESSNKNQLNQLIKSGANLNARDISGVTPLELTLQLHRHDQLYELVFAGANLNDLDSFGRGYIHTAIALNQFNMAWFLISQGAKITEPNRSLRRWSMRLDSMKAFKPFGCIFNLILFYEQMWQIRS